MKKYTLVFLFLILAFSGCDKKPTLPPVDSVKTVLGSTQSSITSSSNTIDGIVDGSPFEAPVKVETDKLRAVVPDIDFEKIHKEYQLFFDELNKKHKEEIKLKDKRISDFSKLTEKLKNRIKDLENFARAQQVLWLNIAAGILSVATGILLYFRQRELAGYSALGAISAFGLAQILGSIWFFWICVAAVLIVSAGVSLSFYKQNVSNEAETIVMETLEEAYNESDKEMKDWMDIKIFDKLSKKMDSKHKKYVREKKI